MVVHSFIAQYLQAKGYHQTLAAFEAEHGSIISPEVPIDETLEDIITDRIKYLSTDNATAPGDIVLDPSLQKIRAEQLKDWSTPYPKTPTTIGPWTDLVVDCAVLERSGRKYVLCCTTKKSLVVVDHENGSIVSELPNVINVVVRKMAVCGELVLLCGMNGKLSIGRFDSMEKLEILSETQIHPRLITDIRVVQWNGEHYVVSMGWDFYVRVFKIEGHELASMGEYKLSSQGSCMDAGIYQDKLYVVVCKKDITLMDVLCMDSKSELRREYRIALNDAEFSASGFTPMCVRMHVSGVPLVAVATSHEPYMRIVLVTLKDAGIEADEICRNQIMANTNTMSPQDKYSEAKIRWRGDGSGLWIFGEDGKIRGLDLLSGKIAVELPGHDGRIRCVSDELVTCGTDKTVMIWH